MKIERLEHPAPAEREALLEVWESSVRATHAFLSEDDIVALRPQVWDAFEAVSLMIAHDEAGRLAGFAGICGDMLEMLFIRAEARGLGIGGALLARALEEGVLRVDVNEQNPQALGFYQHLGFEVTGRSPLDGQGRPFPLLHLRLQDGLKPMPRGYSIRAAAPGDIPCLNAIELAAATLFPPGVIPQHVLSDRVPEVMLAEAMRDGRLWVAFEPGGTPVGYALLRFLKEPGEPAQTSRADPGKGRKKSAPGLALLAQMDVHPAHTRKRLGTGFVRLAAAAARMRRAEALYLTTFADIPWNAPFYARQGFADLSESEQPRVIRDILAEERARGLKNRTAMRLPLSPPVP